ncbi:MAG: hypothetical protein PHE24_02205 [Patescibacteria group bacterium]|nr:hypothetical protein [Patescibacteria group bacterium]
MIKIINLTVLVCLTAISNCSNPANSGEQKEPEPGIYFSAYVGKQGGRPMVFIWSGSAWKCGNNNSSLSVSGASFSGDSVADINVHCQTDTSVFDFKARAVRLPVKIGDYDQADSAHPFLGLYSSYQKPPSPYSFGGNDIFLIKADLFVAYLGWPYGSRASFSCSMLGNYLTLGNGWGTMKPTSSSDTIIWSGPNTGINGEHLFRLN